jgi:hypothetical protein
MLLLDKTSFLDQKPRGQCSRRVIVEAKQRSQKSVKEWVTKIYHP